MLLGQCEVHDACNVHNDAAFMLVTKSLRKITLIYQRSFKDFISQQFKFFRKVRRTSSKPFEKRELYKEGAQKYNTFLYFKHVFKLVTASVPKIR
jgi:hypothetical protein